MNQTIYHYPDLAMKTVFVTGGTRGIGLSIVKKLLQNECKVVMTYRSENTRIQLSKGEFEKIEFIQTDLNQIENIEEWLSRRDNRAKKVDVLINNAGIYISKPLLQVRFTDWDEIFNINLRAVFFISQLFAIHMKKNGGGVILNAASFAATIPSYAYGVYAASKAALVSLTKSMAGEFAPYNIRVNAYSPGVIETDMTREVIQRNHTKVLNAISLNRIGVDFEVANLVLFLASEASSYITGANMDISGGKLVIQDPDSPRI